MLWDGQVLVSEEHTRSPATRWYTQPEARALSIAAGFTEIQILSGFSFRPAARSDTLFCLVGRKA